MVNYSFTTDQGWRVTEYRPFSLSYGVLHSPGLHSYPRPLSYGHTQESDLRASEGDRPAPGANLLESLTSQQLKFSYFSFDVLRQLLQERVNIRDRSRSAILGRITDLSGDIYCCSMLRTSDSYRRRQGLEKTKLDLERELRETDERLWKDTAEIREHLIAAGKQYESTQLRTGLLTRAVPHDDDKGQDDATLSG